MKLLPRCVPDWPKLAWVATARQGSDLVLVRHGPMVEVADGWMAEAVWAGDFASGDFDRTDLVYGSGVRVRGDGVVFVSSATGVDRLWHCEHKGAVYVSNSLPALMAVSGLSLCQDYPSYLEDLLTVEMLGIKRYKRFLTAMPEPVGIVYFENLVYDGRSLMTAPKPEIDRDFSTYARYRSFLTATATSLANNLRDPLRQYSVVPLTSISRGYDSPAASVIAREAGCTRAATIRDARSVLPSSDDGTRIANRLGLECNAFRLRTRDYRFEVTLWAATGHAGGLNMTVLDYPEPLCLFFSGSDGEKVWDANFHDLSEPVGDNDMMLSEFRLVKGMFHCVVPWWGIRQAQQTNRLGSTEEMKPWLVGSNYERPIARRIVEEAGVPREWFGQHKMVTASNTPFRWPFSRECRDSFRTYLKRAGRFAPPCWLVWALRRLVLAEHLVYWNVIRRLRLPRCWRPWTRLGATSLLFQWANEELKARYSEALRNAPGESGRPEALPSSGFQEAAR